MHLGFPIPPSAPPIGNRAASQVASRETLGGADSLERDERSILQHQVVLRADIIPDSGTCLQRGWWQLSESSSWLSRDRPIP
ncbi:MAG: hypothetical protein ACK2UE_19155 [Anaerolineales bacterium]|jgi:hypothetical protein